MDGTGETGERMEEDSRFYYNGTTQGAYRGSTTIFEIVFDFFLEAADWIIGILTIGFKIQFIGWTGIAENLVSSAVNSSLGETNNSQTNESIGEVKVNNDTDKKITIEKIIFNKIPILDINLFDFDNAGGQVLEKSVKYQTAGGEVEKPSIVYMIRENISIWYNVIRNFSIVCLLVILIYVGIRIAISTIAEEKAQYKRILMSWLAGFVIVLFIHVFIYFVININYQMVDMFAAVNKVDTTEAGLYETIVVKAYDMKASQGWTGTIMYMVLVYYMIRFLFVYAKRLLIIYILVLISPLTGLTYSISKVKDGNGNTTALAAWVQEFVFNVLIQMVHTILYIVFVSIAFELATSSLGGMIIGFVFLQFMLKAEGIVKKIFGFKAKSLKDVMEATAGIMAGFMAIKAAGSFIGRRLNIRANKKIDKKTEKLYNKHYRSIAAASATRNVQNVTSTANVTSAANTANVANIANTANVPYNYANGYYGDYETDSSPSDDVANRLKEAIREDLKRRHNLLKDSLNFGKDVITGPLRLMAGIPMALGGNAAGLVFMTTGYDAIRRRFPSREKPIKRPATLAYGKKGRIIKGTLKAAGTLPIKVVLKPSMLDYNRILTTIENYKKFSKASGKAGKQRGVQSKTTKNTKGKKHKQGTGTTIKGFVQNSRRKVYNSRVNRAVTSVIKSIAPEEYKTYDAIMRQPYKLSALQIEYAVVEQLIQDMEGLGKRNIYKDNYLLNSFEQQIKKQYKDRLDSSIQAVLERKDKKEMEQVIADVLQNKPVSNITEKDIEAMVTKMSGSKYSGNFRNELASELKSRNITSLAKLHLRDIHEVVNNIVEKQDMNLPQDIRLVVKGVKDVMECQREQGIEREQIKTNITELINAITQDNIKKERRK